MTEKNIMTGFLRACLSKWRTMKSSATSAVTIADMKRHWVNPNTKSVALHAQKMNQSGILFGHHLLFSNIKRFSSLVLSIDQRFSPPIPPCELKITDFNLYILCNLKGQASQIFVCQNVTCRVVRKKHHGMKIVMCCASSFLYCKTTEWIRFNKL